MDATNSGVFNISVQNHGVNLNINSETGELLLQNRSDLSSLSIKDLMEFKKNLSDALHAIEDKKFWSGKVTTANLQGNSKVIADQVKQSVDHIISRKNIFDRGLTHFKGGIGEQRHEVVKKSVEHLMDEVDHMIKAQEHLKGIHDREINFTKQLKYVFEGKVQSDATTATFKFGSVGMDAHRYLEKDNLVLEFKGFPFTPRVSPQGLTGEELVKERTLSFFHNVYQIAYGPEEGKKKLEAFEKKMETVTDENGYAKYLKEEIEQLTKLAHPGDKTACLLVFAALDQRINLDLGSLLVPSFLDLISSIEIEKSEGKVSGNIQDCEKKIVVTALPNGRVQLTRSAQFDIGFDSDTGGVSKGQGYWEIEKKEYRPLALFESTISLEIDPKLGSCVKVEGSKKIIQKSDAKSRLAAQGLGAKLAKGAVELNLPELGQIPVIEERVRPKLADILKSKTPQQ